MLLVVGTEESISRELYTFRGMDFVVGQMIFLNFCTNVFFILTNFSRYSVSFLLIHEILFFAKKSNVHCTLYFVY